MDGETPFLETLYQRLERIRLDKGLDMESFSEAIGKHKSWYEKALAERADIGVVELIMLAKTFNVKASHLLD